jgi:hypothetical protein
MPEPRKKSRRWYAENRERILAEQRAAYALNKDAIRAQQKAFRKANPGRYSAVQRIRNLKAMFGMVPADYERMLQAQGGTCAICKATSPGRKRDKHFHIDHDHATGKIRGLLCNRCNSFLGVVEGWLEQFKAAVEAYRAAA